MDRKTLRKVQMVQLEIAKEVRRVCDENGINYFLEAGTLLGAVRHQGFIPWDDDLDLGMLREDYERFCEIAPEKLGPKYYLQTWRNDSNYPLPFAKVRKRNTVFIEGKTSRREDSGIYIDIFPYDNSPENAEEKQKLRDELCDLARILLMKDHFQPWFEDGKINWKKRIGYLYYQLRALFTTHEKIVKKYEALVYEVKESSIVYEQTGIKKLYYFPKKCFDNLHELDFESEKFKCPSDEDGCLKELYGNYWELPPESERENRHQILELDFGDDE